MLNLDSSAVQQDSIIYQARIANKRLLFYGDETWLKLFPNSFIRHDGTTSFYISDYTEVILEFRLCSCIFFHLNTIFY